MTTSLEGLSTEEKRELLVRVLRRKARDESRQPLSPNQLQLWLLDQVDPGNINYTLLYGIRIEGEIDITVGQRAVDEIIRRHESLRTTFHSEGGIPFQEAAPSMTVPVRVKDLRTMDQGAQDAAVREIVREEARTPFSLTDGPLVRFLTLHLGETEHIALIAMHHIISDGWSLGVFVREFGLLYAAFSHGRPSPLADLPIQLREYLRQRREQTGPAALERLSAYWEGQLQGAPPGIDLTPGVISSGLLSNEGAQLSLLFPEGLCTELKRFSSRQGVTIFMTLFAAFLAVLSRTTGQEDLIVASPMADRDRPETQGLIGFMVDSLLLRVRLDGNPTVRELLRRARDVVIDAQEHRDYPFDLLVRTAQRVRHPGTGSLTQVLFALQNMPLPPLVHPGVRIALLELDTGIAPVDFWAQFLQKAEALELLLVYKTALFSRAVAERLARGIEEVLKAFLRDAELRLADLPCGVEVEEPPGRRGAQGDRAYLEPQSDLESRLARIWAETLGVEKIRRDDDFFALGGHSLLVIQLVHKVNDALGIVLPFKAIFECPTVRQLAARLATSGAGGVVAAEGSGVRPLVLMQESGAPATIYCFHQLGGQIHSYMHLARALRGFCNVAGVQSRGVAEPSKEHPSLGAMVEEYAGVLFSHQRTGPYLLMGYSTAAPLAMAVARKLEDAGGAVGLVALIDPVSIPGGTGILDNELLPALVNSLRASFGEEMAAMVPDDETVLQELTGINSLLASLPEEERMGRLYRWMQTLNVPPEAAEMLTRRLELSRRQYELLKAVTPLPVKAPLFLCLSTKPVPGIHVDASLWERCAGRSVYRGTVEADHFAMVRPPHAAVIAEQVYRILAGPSGTGGAIRP